MSANEARSGHVDGSGSRSSAAGLPVIATQSSFHVERKAWGFELAFEPSRAAKALRLWVPRQDEMDEVEPPEQEVGDKDDLTRKNDQAIQLDALMSCPLSKSESHWVQAEDKAVLDLDSTIASDRTGSTQLCSIRRTTGRRCWPSKH